MCLPIWPSSFSLIFPKPREIASAQPLDTLWIPVACHVTSSLMFRIRHCHLHRAAASEVLRGSVPVGAGLVAGLGLWQTGKLRTK